MRKEIIKYYCDTCGQEFKADELYPITAPTLRVCDVEGKPIEYDIKEIRCKRLELCQKCLEKVTVIRDSGTWRGQEYYITEGGVDE